MVNNYYIVSIPDCYKIEKSYCLMLNFYYKSWSKWSHLEIKIYKDFVFDDYIQNAVTQKIEGDDEYDNNLYLVNFTIGCSHNSNGGFIIEKGKKYYITIFNQHSDYLSLSYKVNNPNEQLNKDIFVELVKKKDLKFIISIILNVIFLISIFIIAIMFYKKFKYNGFTRIEFTLDE